MTTQGERIKALRESKGWSQSDLARRVGVTREAVSQWENSVTSNIKNPTLFQVARELGTTPEYLVFGPDGMPHAGKRNRARKDTDNTA